MALLAEKDQKYLQAEFQKLTRPVKLMVFTQDFECQFCKETRELVEEVAGLSEKITAEVINFVPGSAEADGFAVDKIPAIVILADGEKPIDYGIRYFGIPSGYEFTSLIEDIFMVSAGDSGLSTATRQALAEVDSPVHFQVFVTPT